MSEQITSSEYHKILNLITDALSELSLTDCPYCNRYIGIWEYLDDSDIENWLRSHIELQDKITASEF